MPHYYTTTIVDYGNEKSSIRIPMAAVTAINIADKLADMGDLATAIEGLILGDRQKEGWIGDDTVLTSVPATDPNAQVERAWLVTYRSDVTNKLYQTTIATADLSGGRLIANSDMADLSHASWVAFIAAFEALVFVGDNFDEAVTVVRAQHVGRNR